MAPIPASRAAAPRFVWGVVSGGPEKTELVRRRALEGALSPMVRDIAVRLVRSCPRNDHLERLQRLHRFVRDSVPYHREPVEMLQAAEWTLDFGGDCDCLTILLGALAWSLRYPVRFVALREADPIHYYIDLGFPASDSPDGDSQTQWWTADPSAAVLFGESVEAAARRGVML